MQCRQAALRNLTLGRWISDLGRSPRLLQANLHHIFNASVVLELGQLLSVHLNEEDATEVTYAIQTLDSDTIGNGDYAKDCAKVLLDLVSVRRKIGEHNSIGLSRPTEVSGFYCDN